MAALTPYFIKTIQIFITTLQFLIIARAFLSWLPIKRDNPIIGIIYKLTEPILAPVRGLISKSIFGNGNMMVDFSPIIAYFLLSALSYIIARLW